MSAGEGINISSDDILLVQKCIERCLHHYMHKKEAVNAIAVQDNINPKFAELIWQQLEEENPEFFKAYYLKLLVKDQILEFNRLLSEQVELMRQTGVGGIIAPSHAYNGARVSPSQHIPSQNAKALKAETMQQPYMFMNCGSQLHQSGQGTIGGSMSSRKIDVAPSLFLSQNSYAGSTQTSNVNNIPRSETAYVSNSQFDFGPLADSFMEPRRPLVSDGGVPTFNNTTADSNAHHHHHQQQQLNDALLDGDSSSLAFLAQSLGFPELVTDDFPGVSDLLESYESTFVTPDANNLVDAQEHGDPEAAHLRRFHQSD